MSRSSALEELLPPAKLPDIFHHHRGRVARDKEHFQLNTGKKEHTPQSHRSSSDSFGESLKAQSSSALALSKQQPAGKKNSSGGSSRGAPGGAKGGAKGSKRSTQKLPSGKAPKPKDRNYRNAKTYQKGTGLTPQLKAIGLVTKATETVVKFDKASTGIKTAHHLTEAANYIARNGQMAVEDQDGTQLTREEMRERMAQWAEDQDMPATDEDLKGKRAADARRLILSCPAGTDPDKVLQTARQFAKEMLKDDGFDYIMALHVKDENHPNEPDHPHVHILIKAINKDGKRLNPRKDDLKFMRERFAILARRNGIAMNATARAVRGQSERSKPIERVKQEQRYFEEMTKSQTSTNVESEQATPNTAQAAAKGEPSAGQGERTTAQTGRSAGRGEHTAAQAEPSTAKAEPRAQTAEQTQAQKWAIHRKKEELKAKGSTPKASGEEKSPRPHPYQQARDEEIITALKEGKPLDEPEALSKAKRTRKQVQANAAKAVSELASSGDAAEQALAAGLKKHFDDLPPVQSAQERRYNEAKSFIAAKKREAKERKAREQAQAQAKAQAQTKAQTQAQTQAQTKAQQSTGTAQKTTGPAKPSTGQKKPQSQAQKHAINRKKQQRAEQAKAKAQRKSSPDMER